MTLCNMSSLTSVGMIYNSKMIFGKYMIIWGSFLWPVPIIYYT